MAKRDFSRRPSLGIEPIKTYMIATEGEATEYIYFNYLKNLLRAKNIHLSTFHKGKGTTPAQVVQRVLSDGASFSKRNTSLWAIVDFDDRGLIEINKAIALAGDRVDILFSNPCFELWLALHTEKPKTATTVKKCLKLVANVLEVSEYDKAKYDVAKLIVNVSHAIKNAKKLDNNPDEILPNAPASRVYKLVEEIMADLL